MPAVQQKFSAALLQCEGRSTVIQWGVRNGNSWPSDSGEFLGSGQEMAGTGCKTGYSAVTKLPRGGSCDCVLGPTSETWRLAYAAAVEGKSSKGAAAFS